MPKLMLMAVTGLVLNATITAGLYLPGAPTEPVYWASLLIAFACVFPVFYVVNGRAFGSMHPADLLDLLLELPVVARILLAVLLAVTMAEFFLNSSGVQTELDSHRTGALIGVWLCAMATALAFANELRANRPKRSSLDGRSRTLLLVVYIAVGVIFAATMFVLGRDPIRDEAGAHEHLSAVFGQRAWFAHLVAADTNHNTFVVYLDTRDPATLAAACSDLVSEVASLKPRITLHYAASGHGTFVRECTKPVE